MNPYDTAPKVPSTRETRNPYPFHRPTRWGATVTPRSFAAILAKGRAL